MEISNYKKDLVKRGCRILENRTTYKEFEVGDSFSFQALKGPYEIMFFFKDKVFDYFPMIFGYCWETQSCIMVSDKFVKIINKKLKRKRRE